LVIERRNTHSNNHSWLVACRRLGAVGPVHYAYPMRGDVEQALRLTQGNDPAAVENAIAILQDTVFSFSMKVCGHPEDAEDTMQYVLMKSMPRLARFDNPQALKVWLYRVARNRCVSNHRGAKASPAFNLSLDELMPDGHELMELVKSEELDPEASLLNREMGDQLEAAVSSLPEKYRMVLALHDMEELDTAEVAQITGLREGTVRVRLHRARLMVRKLLSDKSKTTRGITIHAGIEPARPPRCRKLFAALSDYMDGLVDDAVCEQMDRHIGDCQPCQIFLRSLKNVVQQCRTYSPECDSPRSQVVRRQLVNQYQAAVADLARRNKTKAALR
jgi:RNA polymerase sigma-70 factor (ECF subfamily)